MKHLRDLKEGSGAGAEIFVEHWRVRLPTDKVSAAYPPADLDEHRFTIAFFNAARCLFGEEVVSLRMVARFRAARHSASDLARELQHKIPSLGAFTCSEFANALLQIIHELKTGQTDSVMSPATSPFRLLVKTALLKDTPLLCSYAEFCQRLGTDASVPSHMVHPLLRLAAWVHMVYEYHSLPVPDVTPLYKLAVIDQVGFPLVLRGEEADLWRCEAFSRRGDLSNLLWLADSMKKGFSIDFKAVRDTWRRYFLTDVGRFSSLVSLAPNPSAVLDVSLFCAVWWGCSHL
jgi:hypothetical protein